MKNPVNTHETETSYIVVFNDIDYEFNTLAEADKMVRDFMGYAEEMQMALPVLGHPSGDGREWCLETNSWSPSTIKWRTL